MEFFDLEEKQLIEEFLENGYVIVDLEKKNLLSKIREKFFTWAKDYKPELEDVEPDSFLDQVHNYLTEEEVNNFRLSLISKLSQDAEFRPLLYNLGKKHIHTIVGNELSMQRAVNLSIQMPHDKTSVLPLHSDVWSGNSPYEIVFWVPLVDCYKTKSMFILPLKASIKLFKNFDKYSDLSAEELFKVIEKDLVWADVPFGKAIIFSHSILHGNRVNVEEETRWTMNCRFKSLLSPYGSKELGESFLPITIRPITRIGSSYTSPKG